MADWFSLPRSSCFRVWLFCCFVVFLSFFPFLFGLPKNLSCSCSLRASSRLCSDAWQGSGIRHTLCRLSDRLDLTGIMSGGARTFALCVLAAAVLVSVAHARVIEFTAGAFAPTPYVCLV